MLAPIEVAATVFPLALSAGLVGLGAALLIVAVVLGIWAAATDDKDSTVKIVVVVGGLGLTVLGWAVGGWIGILAAILIAVLILLSG